MAVSQPGRTNLFSNMQPVQPVQRRQARGGSGQPASSSGAVLNAALPSLIQLGARPSGADTLVGKGTGKFVPGVGEVGTGVPASLGFGQLLGGAGLGMAGGQLSQAISPTDPRNAKGAQFGSILGGIGGSVFGGPAGGMAGGAIGTQVGALGQKTIRSVRESLGKGVFDIGEAIITPFTNPKKTFKSIEKGVKKVFDSIGF